MSGPIRLTACAVWSSTARNSPMNLRHLSYLVALAQEGHFRRAAEVMNITQPTLSAAIRQLESELAVPLVLRTRQRFDGFTAEGREVLAWAQRILADCAALEQSLGGVTPKLTGHLRIGVIPTAEPLIARVTRALQTRYPRITVTMLSHTSREIERGLTEHRIDAGISYAEEAIDASLRSIPIYLERYFVVGAARLLPRRRTSIAWREAATLPLCLLSRDMQNRRLLDRHFIEAGAAPTVVAETNTLIGVLSHVASEGWCGILPTAMLGFVKGLRNIRAVPLTQPEVSHRVALLVPARDPLPPVTRALVNVVGDLDLGAVR